MSNFDKNLLEVIEESQTVLFDIERVLYTRRYNLAQKHFDIFSIQSISMIYSIWEGFVKKSFNLYIDELNSLNVKFEDFSKEIMIFHMESKFKQLIEYPQKTDKKLEFYENLKEFHTIKFHPISRAINSESNVSFDVLNKLLLTFSLKPYPEYWEKYTYPNPNLKDIMIQFLRYRNGVAHGGDVSSEEKVTHFVYEKYKNLVLDLMYSIHEKMMDGLISKTYLK